MEFIACSSAATDSGRNDLQYPVALGGGGRIAFGRRRLGGRTLAGAALISQNSVDLILRDNRRLRAKLERSCPALDYYYGFYITPNPDGRICADRDVIRSRMGGRCQIERFRLLKADKE